MSDISNNAETLTDSNGTPVEVQSPSNSNSGSNGTTFPSSANGQLDNTSIFASNSNLNHICDFSASIQHDAQLKKFLQAQAQNIKEALRAIGLQLGASDATGQYQWLIDDLKAVTRGLKYIQKNVIQPILEFEKMVIGYIAKLKQIIAFIMSLPARIYKFVATCVTDLEKSIAAVFSDGATGGSSSTSDFSGVIAAAKETGAALQQVASGTIQAAGTAAAIVGTAVKVVAPLTRNVKMP